MTLVMWPEKVDRFWLMLWLSPMSTSTASIMPTTEPSPQGMCSPLWAMSVNRPTVFRHTVLPPVFGPVTAMPWSGAASSMSSGTHFSRSSSGCRAFTSRSRRWAVISTGRAPMATLSFARANSASRSAMARMARRSGSASQAT